MKKILTIAFLIMLIITIFQINSLYALYKSEISGELTTDIGKWNITVDGNSITSAAENTETYVISDSYIGYDTSTVVASDKIAPGRTGYFDLLINPNDTDVSFSCNVNVKTSTITNVTIKVNSIEEYYLDESGNKIDDTTKSYSESQISSVFLLSDINQNYKKNIRVHFEWFNDEEKNQADTTLGTNEESKISIPVEFSATQYTGEE